MYKIPGGKLKHIFLELGLIWRFMTLWRGRFLRSICAFAQFSWYLWNASADLTTKISESLNLWWQLVCILRASDITSLTASFIKQGSSYVQGWKGNEKKQKSYYWISWNLLNLFFTLSNAWRAINDSSELNQA